jgi:hypothetical protein
MIMSLKGLGAKTNRHSWSNSDSELLNRLSQLRVAVVRSEQIGSWGRAEFGKPEEGERPPLEAAAKQRLVKTEKTLCVL